MGKMKVTPVTSTFKTGVKGGVPRPSRPPKRPLKGIGPGPSPKGKGHPKR